MNLIILHGNGVVAISNKLSQIKKDFDSLSIFDFNGKKNSLENILADISTGGLFSEKRLVVLEEFEKIDLEMLPKDGDLTIVLKYSKLLASNSIILKKASSLKAQVVGLTEKDEVSVFPFLDALAEKRSKVVFDQLNSLLSQYGGQYILTMLLFMLRRLVAPPANLPPFVLNKIKFQQKNFNIEKIASLYKSVLETDFKIKKGLLEEKLGLTLLINEILN